MATQASLMFLQDQELHLSHVSQILGTVEVRAIHFGSALPDTVTIILLDSQVAVV